MKDRFDDYLVLPTELEVQPLPQRSRMVAADGSLIAWLYLENRVDVDRLADVPEHVRRAVVAIEDSRFYDHRGVDVKGSVRAAVRNGLSGEVEQGGSTLTQQYVKNALLVAATTDAQRTAATEVSIERKLREARYALALERELSKDEILLRYLNIAYYGNGAHGLGTAADFYFTRSVRTLTVAQGALLAGIVQSPGRLDPVDNPEAALARRNVVLARMAAVGWLTEPERAAAAAEPLGLKLRDIRSGCEAPGVPAPFFCDYVRRALEDGPLGATLGSTREQRQQRLLGGGLTIQTTLDTGMQRHAQAVVTERIGADDPSGVAATFTAVEPGTGQVKALVVNRRFGEASRPGSTKVNLAVGGSSGMQAGSTFKPFVLAAAVEQGIPLDTTVDAPATYTSTVFKNCARGRCDEPYTVSNAGDSNAGRHDLVSATHGSVNTAYLQLLERTGVDRPVEIAEAMGLRQFRDRSPSAPCTGAARSSSGPTRSAPWRSPPPTRPSPRAARTARRPPCCRCSTPAASRSRCSGSRARRRSSRGSPTRSRPCCAARSTDRRPDARPGAPTSAARRPARPAAPTPRRPRGSRATSRSSPPPSGSAGPSRARCRT